MKTHFVLWLEWMKLNQSKQTHRNTACSVFLYRDKPPIVNVKHLKQISKECRRKHRNVQGSVAIISIVSGNWAKWYKKSKSFRNEYLTFFGAHRNVNEVVKKKYSRPTAIFQFLNWLKMLEHAQKMRGKTPQSFYSDQRWRIFFSYSLVRLWGAVLSNYWKDSLCFTMSSEKCKKESLISESFMLFFYGLFFFS